MKITLNFICILMIVLLLLCTTSCEPVSLDQFEGAVSNSTPVDPLEGIVTEAEYNETKAYIDGLIEEVSLDLKAYSGYVYMFKREYSDRLIQVGYKGLPVLITEIEKKVEASESYLHCAFLSSGVYALFRVNELPVRDKDNGTYSRSTKKVFCELYKDTKNQIPQIIKSNKSIEEKIVELREFGIFSMPYILKQIDEGHTEYAAYFTAIGLHMDTAEFMTYMSTKDSLWEHGYDKEGFMDGAEDFDYKVWLEENKEDLDNLFKFLDAYCAEYEAEMNMD